MPLSWRFSPQLAQAKDSSLFSVQPAAFPLLLSRHLEWRLYKLKSRLSTTD